MRKTQTPMRNSPYSNRPRKIETIKKELFERIRAQVSDRLGLQDQEIKKSETAFRRFFGAVKKSSGAGWKRVSTLKLQKRIDASDVVFWGDFHGVRQYQKNLVRWLKKQDLQKRPIVLALECLPSRAQKKVDQFLTGQISEEEFLSQVRWSKTWGFPWSHYKPLFDWARENRQVLRVINGPTPQSSSKKREKWGLDQLLKIQQDFPDAQVFVLYGEYHLLPGGFAAHLKKKKSLRPLFIFQNSDSLYFQKPPVKQTSEGEIFALDDEHFCIQNVSPWVKWQNYNLFLESNYESDFDDDFELTEHVLGLSQLLSQTLKLPLDPNSCAIFTSGDRALWDHLKKLRESEFRLFEGLIEESMSFVEPTGGWGFLGRITANETASLAMQALVFQFNPKLRWAMPEEQLAEFLIWIHSFSYFGSKIVNPHRKSPTLLELQKKSRVLSGRPIERQAARLAVNYTLHQSIGSVSPFSEMNVSDSVRYQAIRWISSLLGEKIYNAYNQGALSAETLKSFLLKNPAEKHFSIVIQSLYELVESF